MHTYIGLHTYILYMSIYMHGYIHAYIHTYLHVYIHIQRYTYIHAYMHACIHTYMHTCIHTYITTYIHRPTYIGLHTYIYTYIHTYLHTYIHTLVCLLKMKVEHFNLPPFKVVRFIKKKRKKVWLRLDNIRGCPLMSEFEECSPIVFDCAMYLKDGQIALLIDNFNL